MTNTATSELLRDFLSESQLATEFGVNRKTLHRWSREGRGPARTKIGRAVFYNRNSILKWLAQREQTGVNRTVRETAAKRRRRLAN